MITALLLSACLGAELDFHLERRLDSIEQRLARIEAKLETIQSSVKATPTKASGRYVTTTICEDGTCRLVEKWVANQPVSQLPTYYGAPVYSAPAYSQPVYSAPVEYWSGLSYASPMMGSPRTIKHKWGLFGRYRGCKTCY